LKVFTPPHPEKKYVQCAVCVADGNRVIEEELVPFATARKSYNEDDFDDLLQFARERQSHQ